MARVLAAGALQRYVNFIFSAGIAARQQDVCVADNGARRVDRFEPTPRVLNFVPVNSPVAVRLRMVGPGALAVDGALLCGADGPGARVGVARVAASGAERP